MNHKRLKQLRDRMADAKLDYYYVPHADAHRNEYVPDCWQRRAWITGFTGSAGEALIGKEQAYLWTDGRYFLQAEQQLDPRYFQLMKQQPGTPSIDQWLITQGSSLRIGIDPTLLTVKQYQTWETALQQTHSQLISIEENWIDVLWEDQPPLPITPILLLDIRYTGRNTTDKLKDLRKALNDHRADATVITRLDAIAWLFNIRGNDIQYNPLTLCYAIVTQNDATLFIHPQKISENDRSYFQSCGITLADYDDFAQALQRLEKSVLLDPNSNSWWTKEQLKKAKIIFATCPITLMKALKNPTEQNGMREAHRIDGIAMTKFLCWIETHWQNGVTEISAAQQLELFRREDKRCRDLSFSTISGFASNGAIIHYTPEAHTNKTIDDSALYLIDSGGQYFEGTTDVTRTIHLGQPTVEEKIHYTRVLKGHIALRHTKFPAGTFGEQVDGFARRFLWEAGFDYAHGTGHGVGCYLCVHEGPQVISPRTSSVPLQAGMTVSNEPGLYLKDRYGIRIENVCLVCTDDADPHFYTFEDLTLVPYARNLIDTNLLNAEEIRWIDTYHQQIYQRLTPELSKDVAQWLKEATTPL